MILDAFPGDENSFVNNFQTAREQANYANEEKQADLLLRILDEMESGKKLGGRHQRKKEYLRIAENGDIVRDDEEKSDKKKIIMGIDDLPKETLDEMLFGKPKEEQPMVKVETGRRLKDGRISQRVNIDDFEFSLNTIKFETLLLIAAFVFFVFMIFRRFFAKRKSEHEYHERHKEDNIDLDRLIEKKVNERLTSLLLNRLS